MKGKLDKVALIAPNENFEGIISYLSSKKDYDIDHFPNLEQVECLPSFPLGKYSLVVLDSGIKCLKIDNDVLNNLKAVFGDCAFVVIDRDNVWEDFNPQGVVRISGPPDLYDILESGFRAHHYNEVVKITTPTNYRQT